ncbi:MAG: hypothetical protein V1921_04925 [Candidatus Altiarchaeota archaeon]
MMINRLRHRTFEGVELPNVKVGGAAAGEDYSKHKGVIEIPESKEMAESARQCKRKKERLNSLDD